MERIKDYSPSLSSRLLLSRFQDKKIKKSREETTSTFFYPFSFKCFKMEVSIGRSLNEGEKKQMNVSVRVFSLWCLFGEVRYKLIVFGISI